jgi:hypothetical protein
MWRRVHARGPEESTMGVRVTEGLRMGGPDEIGVEIKMRWPWNVLG